MFPDFKQSWILLAIIIAVMVGVSMMVAVLSVMLGMDAEPVLNSGLPNVLIIGTILVGTRFLKPKHSFRELYPMKAIPPVLYLAVLLLAVGLSPALSEMDNLLRIILPMPEWLQQLFLETFYGQTFLQSVILLGVIAPVTEELLFRGLILQGLEKQTGSRNAIMWSSLMFAILHMNPWQALGAFVIGIFLGWVFVNTRSLIPCLLIHSLYNLTSVVMMQLGVEIEGYTMTEATTGMSFQPLWFTVSGLAITVLGVYLLNREMAEMKFTKLFAGRKSEIAD